MSKALFRGKGRQLSRQFGYQVPEPSNSALAVVAWHLLYSVRKKLRG